MVAELKQQIINAMKARKRNITEGTIKTYTSLLNTLMKRLNTNDFKQLENFDHVIPEIKKMTSPQTIKTTLSALFVTTGNDKYKNEMIQYSDIVNKEYALKKTKDERKQSDMSIEKINKLFNDYKKRVKLFPDDQQLYQDYVIIALTSGIFIPPRRNLDWCAMKIKNVDKKQDNYIEGNNFVFNKFKTAKFVSAKDKVIEIPKQLKSILKKWIQMNDSDYLIYNKNGCFSSSSLSKKLQKIYGDGVTVDTIRSLYLTKNYKKTADELEKLNETAKKMGTSTKSILSYYIKDDQE